MNRVTLTKYTEMKDISSHLTKAMADLKVKCMWRFFILILWSTFMHISFLNFVSEMWMQKHSRLHAFSSHDFFHVSLSLHCIMFVVFMHVCCVIFNKVSVSVWIILTVIKHSLCYIWQWWTLQYGCYCHALICRANLEVTFGILERWNLFRARQWEPCSQNHEHRCLVEAVECVASQQTWRCDDWYTYTLALLAIGFLMHFWPGCDHQFFQDCTTIVPDVHPVLFDNWNIILKRSKHRTQNGIDLGNSVDPACIGTNAVRLVFETRLLEEIWYVFFKSFVL